MTKIFLRRAALAAMLATSSLVPAIAVHAADTPNNGGTITVTYKQVGISLAFTPTIIGDRINLKVAPEVSQVTTDGQVSVALSPTASIIVPAIQTRCSISSAITLLALANSNARR